MMQPDKFSEMDVRDLPWTLKIKGRKGRSKFYVIKPSGDGAQMCGADKLLEQLLAEKYPD